MQRLRQAALFDLHSVDLNILRSNLEASGAFTESQPIISIGTGCGCLWLGDSTGRVHRATLDYKLSDNVLPISSPDHTTSSSSAGAVNNTVIDDEPNICSPNSASDPLLSVTEASVFPIFGSKVTQIIISSTKEMVARRSGQFLDCEALLIIGRELNDWRCKVFLINQSGKFVSKGQGFKNFRLSRTSTPSPPSPSVDASSVTRPIKEIILVDSNSTGENAPLFSLSVVCAALNSDATKLVVGLSNGSLICYQTDFQNPDDPIKARHISLMHNSDDTVRTANGRSDASHQLDPITNLYFCQSDSLKSEVLFVTTLQTVVCLSLSSGTHENPSIIYRDTGCGCRPRCAALNSALESLLVLREGGLFVFHSEQGNLSALPCDGSISMCALCEAYRYYSITVTQDPHQPSGAATAVDMLSKPIQHHRSSSTAYYPYQQSMKQTLNIALNFPSLRLLAFSCRLSDVAHVIQHGPSSLLVLTRLENGGVGAFEVREKTPIERLEILIKKRMFEWAVEIAKRDEMPEEFITETRVLHSEWLFDKAKYMDAAEAFCLTIGHVEPSHVIAKFLSCQRLDCLIVYIKRLYTSGVATPAQLAILFKCFSLRRDISAFEHFIDTTAKSDDGIDWTVAIDECRSAGYFHLAKKIAQHQNLPPLLLSILIDDLDDTSSAIDYLSTSISDEACIALLLQGHIGAPLLRKQPEKTLKLIERLLEIQQIDLGLFIPLFFDVEEEINKINEQQQAEQNQSQQVSGKTRFSLDLGRRDVSLSINKDLEIRLLKLLTDALNKAAKDPDSAPPISLQVAMTALEVLFRRGRGLRRKLNELLDVEGSDDKEKLEKEITLLDQEVEIILRHHVKSDDRLLTAFCLSRLYGNDSALTLLCERVAALYGSRLRSRIEDINETNIDTKCLWAAGVIQTPFVRLLENGDNETLLSYCLRIGAADSSIWPLAISYLSQSSNPNEAVQRLLNHLKHVEGPAPHTLTILNLLGRPSIKPGQKGVNLGAIKEYLLHRLSPIKESRDQNISQFRDDCQDISETRQKIYRLCHEIQRFSLTGLTCRQCDLPVDLPIIQFFCGHAYHRYCLSSPGTSEGRPKCPQCYQENDAKKKFLYDRVALLLSLDAGDFIKDLRNSDHGPVPIITQVLGRGLLLREISEPPPQSSSTILETTKFTT